MNKQSESDKRDRKKSLSKELKRLEGVVYDLETKYLKERIGGDAYRGWDIEPDEEDRDKRQVSSSDSDASSAEGSDRIDEDEMLFSKSSSTSPVGAKAASKSSKSSSSGKRSTGKHSRQSSESETED